MMKVAEIPYDIIHQIEDKYGTLAIPDNNPLMIKLHKTTGAEPRLKMKTSATGQQFTPHYYDDEVIRMVKMGYSVGEIATKLGHTRSTINRILLYYRIKPRDIFKGKYDDVYIVNLSNLKYWGIVAKNTEVAKRKTHHEFIVKKYHWCDIEPGEKYMVAGNDTEVFVKK